MYGAFVLVGRWLFIASVCVLCFFSGCGLTLLRLTLRLSILDARQYCCAASLYSLVLYYVCLHVVCRAFYVDACVVRSLVALLLLLSLIGSVPCDCVRVSPSYNKPSVDVCACACAGDLYKPSLWWSFFWVIFAFAIFVPVTTPTIHDSR